MKGYTDANLKEYLGKKVKMSLGGIHRRFPNPVVGEIKIAIDMSNRGGRNEYSFSGKTLRTENPADLPKNSTNVPFFWADQVSSIRELEKEEIELYGLE